MKRLRLPLALFLLLLLASWSISLTSPHSATLLWDPSDGALGYKVYRGETSGNYNASEDVGNVTSWELLGLSPEITYYFAATAYNEDGESYYSNEVVYAGQAEGIATATDVQVVFQEDQVMALTYFGGISPTSAASEYYSLAFCEWTEAAYTCPGTGLQNVGELSYKCYPSSGTPNIRLAIYSEDKSTKIVEGTVEVAITGESVSWQGHMTAAECGNAQLTGGTKYILAVSVDTINVVRGYNVNAGKAWTYLNSTDYTGGFPASLGTGTNGGGYEMAIRCGVEPAAAVTVTKTLSLDSLLQKIYTKTPSLHALLNKVGLTKVVSADAYLYKTILNTVSIDGLLNKVGLTKTSSLDSLLQKLGLTKTPSLDAYLQKFRSSDASLDSMLQKPQTKSASLDSYLQKERSGAVSLDAFLYKIALKTLGLDSYLAKERTGTASLDALLNKVGAASTVSMDALLTVLGLTRASSIDALLNKVGVAGSASVDALLTASLTKACSLDAYLYKPNSQSAGADAVLMKSGLLATLSLDAILIAAAGPGTQVVSLDSLLQAIKSKSLAIDAYLYSVGSKSASLDALMSKGYSRTASFDGLLQGSALKSSLLDGLLLKLDLTKSSTLDAYLSRMRIEALSVDGLLSKSNARAALLDGLLSKEQIKTALLDAILTAAYITITKDVHLDALLLAGMSKHVGMDAYLVSSDVMPRGWKSFARGDDIPDEHDSPLASFHDRPITGKHTKPMKRKK